MLEKRREKFLQSFGTTYPPSSSHPTLSLPSGPRLLICKQLQTRCHVRKVEGLQANDPSTAQTLSSIRATLSLRRPRSSRAIFTKCLVRQSFSLIALNTSYNRRNFSSISIATFVKNPWKSAEAEISKRGIRGFYYSSCTQLRSFSRT